MFVKGDPDLYYGSIAGVIDDGHRAGVDNIGIITPKVEQRPVAPSDPTKPRPKAGAFVLHSHKRGPNHLLTRRHSERSQESPQSLCRCRFFRPPLDKWGPQDAASANLPCRYSCT